jgi:hypothetical protein
VESLSFADGGGSTTTAIAVLIRCAMTQPTIFSREETVDGRRNRYAFDSRSADDSNDGDDNARLIVSRRVLSCRVRRQRNEINKKTAILTLVPTLPPMSALKHTILPVLPSFNLIPFSTSRISVLNFSLSSSFPHSIPLFTRAQWARCRLSSSGAPFVYDSWHTAHVRRTVVSIEKCNCVSDFCFATAFVGFPLARFFNCVFTWSSSGRFRFTAVGGGIGGGDEDA